MAQHNLHLLRLFCAVAEAGGFTRAAERLHVSQQAISLQVRRLERDLGFELLTRTPQGVTLTRVGSEVYQRAQGLLQAVRDFDLWLESLRSSDQSSVCVVCSPTPGGYIMPAILPEFRRRYPEVEVILRVEMTDKLGHALAETPNLDFAVFVEEYRDPQLSVQPLAEDELWLVARPDHPLAAAAGPLDLPALAAHTLILREGSDSIARRMLREFNQQGLQPRTTFVGSFDGCRTAAQQGLGFTYLPRLAVEESVKSKALQRLHAPAMQHTRSMYLAIPTGHRLSDPAKHLLALFRKKLADLVTNREQGQAGA